MIRRSWQSPLIVLLVREAVRPTANTSGAVAAEGVDQKSGGESFGAAAAAAGVAASPAGGSAARRSDAADTNGGVARNESGTAVKTISTYGLHVFGFGCPRDASLQVLCRHQLFVQLDYRE